MTVTEFFDKIESKDIVKPNILINQKPLVVRKNKEKNTKFIHGTFNYVENELPEVVG